jgi:hypothetical protein
MIEPTYRRHQLWGRARRGVNPAIVLGACAGAMIALVALVVFAAAHASVFSEDSPRSHATMTVAKLVHERFPAWRAHHAGCPHRLSELLPTAPVDPWGHAMHYTCDPRLGLGGRFAVISAGEDGAFGTADDIEAHQ